MPGNRDSVTEGFEALRVIDVENLNVLSVLFWSLGFSSSNLQTIMFEIRICIFSICLSNLQATTAAADLSSPRCFDDKTIEVAC